MDTCSKEIRRYTMTAIKGKNTKPEIYIRKLLSSLGYRYKLHGKNLPGRPDIVLGKYKTAIFINGCFWHRHKRCKFSKKPKTNREAWNKKFKENISRDEQNYLRLKKMGYKVLIFWECEIKGKNSNDVSKWLKNN